MMRLLSLLSEAELLGWHHPRMPILQQGHRCQSDGGMNTSLNFFGGAALALLHNWWQCLYSALGQNDLVELPSDHGCVCKFDHLPKQHMRKAKLLRSQGQQS